MNLLTDISQIVTDLLALVHSDGAAKVIEDVKKIIADFKAGRA